MPMTNFIAVKVKSVSHAKCFNQPRVFNGDLSDAIIGALTFEGFVLPPFKYSKRVTAVDVAELTYRDLVQEPNGCINTDHSVVVRVVDDGLDRKIIYCVDNADFWHVLYHGRGEQGDK